MHAAIVHKADARKHYCIKTTVFIYNINKEGRLGGSVGEASEFGSGHDLAVRGFKPRVGLCADSSEPARSLLRILCLPLRPSPTGALSHCVSQKINKG